MAKIAYLAGKITGDAGWRVKFRAAAERVKGMGYVVLSPHILPDGLDYQTYMAIDEVLQQTAQETVLLSDWRTSKGASYEYVRACTVLGQPVFELRETGLHPLQKLPGWTLTAEVAAIRAEGAEDAGGELPDDVRNGDRAELVRHYESSFGQMIRPQISEALWGWMDTFPVDVIKAAIDAAVRYDRQSMAYVQSVLIAWNEKGFATLAEVERAQQKFEEKKKAILHGAGGKKKEPDYPQREYTEDDFKHLLVDFEEL